MAELKHLDTQPLPIICQNHGIDQKRMGGYWTTGENEKSLT